MRFLFNVRTFFLLIGLTVLTSQTPLLAQGSFTLLFPNGGETFTGDETIEVTWTATGFDPGERVELEYSVDGGSQWRNIGRSTAGAGRLAWQVPNRPSTTVLARISNRDGDISDVSNSFFEIAENPLDRTLMIAPNGGEILTTGETFVVEWQLPLDAIEATLEFSTDFGFTWSEVATVPATPARYSWTVPDLGAQEVSSAVMRVSITEAPDHFDESDAPFTIRAKAVQEATLKVIFPNGGESFPQDSTIAIQWEATAIPNEVTVEYSPDEGITWNGIGTTLASIGGIAWKTPNKGTTTGLIRVKTKDGSVEDRSNATFIIREKDDIILEPVILLSPNGGEEWIEGEEYAITWNPPADMVAARLAYTSDGGATWNTIDDVDATTGSYQWVVPYISDEPINTVMVRITDTEHPTRVAQSANHFTVFPPAMLSVHPSLLPGTFAIYPNPATADLVVDCSGIEASSITFELVDLQGRHLRSTEEEIVNGRIVMHLDVEDLPAGIYTCVLRSPEAIWKQQILIYR
ncbi:MAG: T9SS type A sorting domain-containing protein [Candidatus Kapaibacterium sp.]